MSVLWFMAILSILSGVGAFLLVRHEALKGTKNGTKRARIS